MSMSSFNILLFTSLCGVGVDLPLLFPHGHERRLVLAVDGPDDK